MAKARLETGSVLDGFTIGECVHAGGMATLWTVTHPGIDVPLLMKIPRVSEGEDPAAILREVAGGFRGSSHEVIADRGEAIRRAVEIAGPGDLVLVAGKGHEDYQVVGAERRHFDDREEARRALGIA